MFAFLFAFLNYNKAPINVAIYSNRISQNQLSKHEIGCLLLSQGCITNYMKTCPFVHVHFTETIKEVENLLKVLMVKK